MSAGDRPIDSGARAWSHAAGSRRVGGERLATGADRGSWSRRAPAPPSARLLAELDALLPSTSADAALLASPVVVVVPSRTLRAHLAARLVAANAAGPSRGCASSRCTASRSRSWTGLGAPPLAGAEVLPVLVARAARGEGRAARPGRLARRRAPSGGRGGARPPRRRRPVSAHVDALDERLGRAPAGPIRRRVVPAPLLRIAGAVAASRRASCASACRRPSSGRPTEARAARPGRALPCRAVFVHGFADATGVATDLIEALLRGSWRRRVPRHAARSRAPEGHAAGGSFTHRFRVRLEGVACKAERPAARRPGSVAGVHARPGRTRRCARSRAGSGSCSSAASSQRRSASSRAISSRTASRSAPLRPSRGPVLACRRARVRDTRQPPHRGAPRRCSARGAEAPVDAWLAACRAPGTRGGRAGRAADVRGVARRRRGRRSTIADVLGEREGARRCRSGAAWRRVAATRRPDERLSGAPRRHLARAELQRAVGRGRRRPWRPCAPSSGAAAAGPTPVRSRARRGSARLARRYRRERTRSRPRWRGSPAALPPELALDRDEFVALLAGAAAGGRPRAGSAAREACGSSASPRPARSRSSHLFLLGLNRDAFPRQVREDPLLPDRVRLALEPLLPDVPVKSRGHDEERFLFAQLALGEPGRDDLVANSGRREEGRDHLAAGRAAPPRRGAPRARAMRPTSRAASAGECAPGARARPAGRTLWAGGPGSSPCWAGARREPRRGRRTGRRRARRGASRRARRAGARSAQRRGPGAVGGTRSVLRLPGGAQRAAPTPGAATPPSRGWKGSPRAGGRRSCVSCCAWSRRPTRSRACPRLDRLLVGTLVHRCCAGSSRAPGASYRPTSPASSRRRHAPSHGRPQTS